MGVYVCPNLPRALSQSSSASEWYPSDKELMENNKGLHDRILHRMLPETATEELTIHHVLIKDTFSYALDIILFQSLRILFLHVRHLVDSYFETEAEVAIR